MQFAVPSPSLSRSGAPQPHAPGVSLPGSNGHSSAQLRAPSPSASPLAPGQAHAPSSSRSAVPGQKSTQSGVLSPSVSVVSACPQPHTPGPCLVGSPGQPGVVHALSEHMLITAIASGWPASAGSGGGCTASPPSISANGNRSTPTRPQADRQSQQKIEATRVAARQELRNDVPAQHARTLL